MLEDSKNPRDYPIFLLLRTFLTNVRDDRQAYVVDGFLKLEGQQRWCDRIETRASLSESVKHFSALWKVYESWETAEAHERSIEGIGAWLRSVKGVTRDELIDDLGLVVGRFAAWASPGLLGGGQRAQLESYGRQIIDKSAHWAQSDQTLSAAKREQAPAQVGVQRWDSGKARIRLVRRVEETHDVTTFEFEAVDGREFSYLPGQSALITLEIDGKKVRRSYTISSSPTRPMRLHFTIKRVPGGLASNWMADHAQPGMEIDISGPKGKFSIQNEMPQKVLMLSGGSGITPMLSMSRYCCDLSLDVDIVFLHMARTLNDLVCAKELESIAKRMRAFKVVYGLSRNDDAQWQGLTGRFRAEILYQAVPDFAQRTVYLCGPVEFMDNARDIFGQTGFDLKRFHFESFGGRAKSKTKKSATTRKTALTDLLRNPTEMRLSSAGADRPPSLNTMPAIKRPPKTHETEQADAEAGGQVQLEVRLRGLDDVFKVAPGDVLLDALEDAGVEVDSSCRAGSCGTCRAQCHKGQVSFENEGGLTDDEADGGAVLLCTAKATTDIELEI